MKIMIIEDDKTIADALAMELSKWQYEPVVAQKFEHIIEEFHAIKPDLVLLDIRLPSFNGYHWCQEIRKFSNVPIIFISSQIDSMNQVMAMQMGGDDFITKPFDLSLTITKIQALLRRTYDFNTQKTALTAGCCRLVPEEAMLYTTDETIDLTRTELQILIALFQNSGSYVSRHTLIEKAWESENFIDDNTLAVNMTRLRKKLQTAGLHDFIETKKNVGYKVDA